MAIDFNKTFGAGSNLGGAVSNDRRDQPKAKIWLNIGYVAENVPVSGSTTGEVEDRFVSLPMGIPLDTMEKLPTNSRNLAYAQFQAARNDLHEQIMQAAQSLEPGEDAIIGTSGGLCIQVRRVQEERGSPAVDDSNPFAKQLLFVDSKN